MKDTSKQTRPKHHVQIKSKYSYGDVPSASLRLRAAAMLDIDQSDCTRVQHVKTR